ncbi:hypothetical protein KUF71_014947 [Frankliniella fusca]|uniref:Uncharacterized protein n=1 Tax=Frankliniella fusca TaxID=407009 RepID=A0AAE1HTM3_9NEOP|nr:hypothetical protein KUF71_014947 [Frankliniella fusca]
MLEVVRCDAPAQHERAAGGVAVYSRLPFDEVLAVNTVSRVEAARARRGSELLVAVLYCHTDAQLDDILAALRLLLCPEPRGTVIVCADFNVDMRAAAGRCIADALAARGLTASSDLDAPSTYGGTTIDAVFSNISIRTAPYQAYYSYHIPLMDLFEAFNAPAIEASQAHPTYKGVALLETLKLHRVQEASLTVTARGPAMKLKMYSNSGEYIFTYVEPLYTEEQCSSVNAMVADGQAPFFFTALTPSGRRINGLVPYEWFFSAFVTYETQYRTRLYTSRTICASVLAPNTSRTPRRYGLVHLSCTRRLYRTVGRRTTVRMASSYVASSGQPAASHTSSRVPGQSAADRTSLSLRRRSRRYSM